MTSSSAAKEKPNYGIYPNLTLEEARAAARQVLVLDGLGKPANVSDLAAITRFYLREARLLDDERYDDWYETLADDLFYWMPLRENRFRREGDDGGLSPDKMAMFDERKADIAVRIGRINSGLVWTEDPKTRHVYVVSNIEVFETATPDEFEVHSVFVQYRNRIEHDDATLFGRRRDIVRRKGDSFELARRLVLLSQSVLLTKNLSVFF
jgi:ethylbenzene dioxygenase subunit beta